jgi:dihydrofolate synthase/folylpolyglutamate synthase
VSNSAALDWLFGTEKIGVRLGLENSRRLFKAAGIETGDATVFHAAGTNGKGSTCAFIESICRGLGKKTGLYTSPHLVSFNERIRINFEPVDQQLLDEEILRLREIVSGWDPHPTYFELTTALAVRVFVNAGVDTIILETGLGGRLDSTNIVDSDVAVITQIALDHEQFLGDTIRAIASEKAGIIGPRQKVVTGNQAPEVDREIAARAENVGSELIRVEHAWPGEIGLTGPHQRWNAALAVEAVRAIYGDCSSIAEESVRTTTWPARFQIFEQSDGPPIVIDGAHNPAAAAELAKTWCEKFGEQRAAIVFGAAADKQPQLMLKELIRITGALFPTTTPTERGLSAEGLVERVRPEAESVSPVPDVGRAIALAKGTRLPVLITGSLFLAGKALEMMTEPSSAAAG